METAAQLVGETRGERNGGRASKTASARPEFAGALSDVSGVPKWYAARMKLLGGKWSRGDILALLGVLAAVLTIPGMPKLFHWDSESSATHPGAPGTTQSAVSPAKPHKPVQRACDVSSGQVNFGCDQSVQSKHLWFRLGQIPEILTRAPRGLIRIM